MMRIAKASLVPVLLLALALATGCQPKVETKTGSRVVCIEGHVISSDIKTVEVPANEVSSYRVETTVQTCPQHAEIEPVYQAAQQAIASGDLKTAQDKLAQVIDGDPNYRKAKQQLDTIKSGKKPTVDTEKPKPPAEVAPGNGGNGGNGGNNGGSDDGTQPDAKPGDGSTEQPAASLLRWTPDSIDGFTATKAVIDPLNIARDYVPAKNSAVVTFVIVAEQAKTEVGAKSALDVQVMQRYPSDKDTFKVNGHEAYFGTDGRRFAALGFTDGSVMVALEMSGKQGESVASLKKALTAAAKQLP